MIQLSVMYPHQEGRRFDMGYYLKDHFDLVKNTWGALIKDARLTRGLSGGAPDAPPPYRIMAHFTFASMDDLKKALDSGGPLFADIPNFTDIRPTVQIGEVLN